VHLLDVFVQSLIAVAGFSYPFNSLSGEQSTSSNELRKVVELAFADEDLIAVLLSIAQHYIPALTKLVSTI
jgi:hypothetical protein